MRLTVWLLRDGNRKMFSGFQTNFMQRNAFQVIGAVAAEEENTPGFPHKDALDVYRDNKRKELEEKVQAHEEAVIDFQVEAQELRLRELELLDAQDKQSLKQLAALRTEYAKIQNLIAEELLFRDIYAKALLAHRNNQALTVLLASYPFLNIVEGSKLIN